jgi:hypothetical protein
MMMEKTYKKIGFYALATLILLWIGLQNRFPLVTSDTGAYINNGFQLYLPADRSLTYSLFMRFTSLDFSLWGVVIAQTLILAWLLIQLIRKIQSQQIDRYKMLAYLVASVFFTSVSWFSSQLMPDIFTAILLISSILYFLEDNKIIKIILLIVAFVSIMMHNSNLITSLLFSGISFLISWKKNLIWRNRARDLTALSAVAILTMASIHALAGHGFILSRGSNIVLIGKLAENGILKKYLKENCSGQYKICEHIDKIPNTNWDFCWDLQSPLYLTGGWDSNRIEYGQILRGTLSKPNYLALHVWKSAEATLRQISQTEIGDGLTPHTQNSNPFWRIEQYFKDELPEYLTSRQNWAVLDFKTTNQIHLLFLFLSSFFVLWQFKYVENQADWRLIYGFVLLFIFCNAFTTATFGNVLARLNSRVFWVLPFLNLIFIGQFLAQLRRKTD